jgi:hypothetical protein
MGVWGRWLSAETSIATRGTSVVLLHGFTLKGRHAASLAPRTIIVALCGPYIRPLAAAFGAAVEVSKQAWAAPASVLP